MFFLIRQETASEIRLSLVGWEMCIRDGLGGDVADIRRAEPVLQSLGQSWSHTGPIGTAKAVKLVNNMMSMGNVLIACDAFALGEAAGVAPATLYLVLSTSGGRSFHSVS